MTDFFEKHKLNGAQKKAVEQTEGFIRLTAGAGSGKTRALVTRYIYLAEELGINPDNILCITFTRKAADEMKKRIAELSAIQLEGSRISTYHGFCRGVVKEDANRLHINPEFEIIDEEEQEKIFREIYEENNLTLADGELKLLNRALYIYKRTRAYIPSFIGLNNRTFEENISRFTGFCREVLINRNYRMEIDEVHRFSIVLGFYLARQIQNSRYDFADLLYFTLYLFSTDEYVLTKWQNRMQYIMVDEYQDSSPDEQKLLIHLSGKHKNLFVVGDPDQSIYSFKGGDISVFLNYPKVFPPTIDLYLNENYRSTQNIVSLANKLITKNKNRLDKESIAMRPAGHPVVHYHDKTDKQTMNFLINEINQIINKGQYTWKDIAIILRTHRSKKPLELALVKAGYPYNIADGIKFYARKEIKQAIAYIRMLHEDNDEAFLLTINTPKRRVGENLINLIKSTSDKRLCSHYQALKYLAEENHLEYNRTKANEYIEVIDWLRTEKDSSLLIQATNILRASGYLQWLAQGANVQRIENVMDLIDSIRLLEIRKQQDVPLEDYLKMIDYFSKKATEDEEKDEIQIMTIHSSKGLEFKVVFLPFFNDGITPNAKSLSDILLIEEERRLAYVAITRAEDLLYFIDSEGYTEKGATTKPSRFLFDFDRSQLYEPKPINPRLIEQWLRFFQNSIDIMVSNPNIFNVGDIILHKQFGRGEIISITNLDYEVKFEKFETHRTIKKNIPLELEQHTHHINNLDTIDLGDSDTEELNNDEVEMSPNLDLTSNIEQEDFLAPLPKKNVNITESTQQVSPNEAIKLSTNQSIEHPLWGIGFIIQQNNIEYDVRFPEIKEVKKIPVDSKIIKMKSYDL